MALAVDGSTPTAVTSTATTGVTASFTPPAGAVLYITVDINSATGATNSLTSITDNRGTHLTYTQAAVQGTPNGNDVVTYLYTAIVTTSVAMTVTATQTNSGSGAPMLLRCVVVTGADTTSTTTPVGAKGGGKTRTTNLSGTAAQYTSTRDGSWGWCTYADWSASAIPTAGSGSAIDASATTSGQATYALIKNSAVTTTSGTVVTITTTAPTASLQLAWIYFEMMPAAGAAATTRKLLTLGVG